MERKLKVGVLGGWRGVSVARGAQANGMEIAAVCDRDAVRVKWAARELGCRAFDDYGKMLDSDIDAVIVANYATEHVRAVKQALAAGKHVMSECLACFTMAEAVELVEAVEAAPNLTYFFAENYPFFPQNMEMRRLFESGDFGKFVYGEAEYVHPISPREMAELAGREDHWRNWLPATYYCTHSMGPVMVITGTRPVAINAIVMPHDFDDPSVTNTLRVNDGGSVLLCRMDNGAAVKILPWSGIRDHGQRCRICCNKGSMEWNQGNGALRLTRWDADFPDSDLPLRQQYDPQFPHEHRQAAQHGHGGGDYFTSYWFGRAIRTGEKPLIDVYRAVDMSMIGIQGYRSALHNSNTCEIPDLHDPAMREKYRHDDWNPDPARPCADKPFPSVLGAIHPTAEAREYHRRVQAEFREKVRKEAEGGKEC